MGEVLLDDCWVFNDRDDAHSTTAGTFEHIDVVAGELKSDSIVDGHLIISSDQTSFFVDLVDPLLTDDGQKLNATYNLNKMAAI